MQQLFLFQKLAMEHAYLNQMGILRALAAMLYTLGLPADISFFPYSWDLSCCGQLLGGFKVVHSAPVSWPTPSVRSQVILGSPIQSAIHSNQ